MVSTRGIYRASFFLKKPQNGHGNLSKSRLVFICGTTHTKTRQNLRFLHHGYFFDSQTPLVYTKSGQFFSANELCSQDFLRPGYGQFHKLGMLNHEPSSSEGKQLSLLINSPSSHPGVTFSTSVYLYFFFFSSPGEKHAISQVNCSHSPFSKNASVVYMGSGGNIGNIRYSWCFVCIKQKTCIVLNLKQTITFQQFCQTVSDWPHFS